jgi:hypothetical protein
VLRTLFALFSRRCPDPTRLREEIRLLEPHAREAPLVVRPSYQLRLARLHLRAGEALPALRYYAAAVTALQATGQHVVARAACREVLAAAPALDRAAADPGWRGGTRELLHLVARAAHPQDRPGFEQWIGRRQAVSWS